MRTILLPFYCLILSVVFFSCDNSLKENNLSVIEETVSENVHTFYYNWYGNMEYDSTYFHWSHSVIKHWSDTTWDHAKGFPGGDDIGANYYPSQGCYSSNDTAIIAKHFEMMKNAGIGVCVISWWGENSFEDQSIPKYLDAAVDHGLKVAFHIEPFYDSIEEFKEQLIYLNNAYGSHDGLFRSNGRPIFYLYDSGNLPSVEWAKLLTQAGEMSIRGTEYDADFIGLWVHENEEEKILEAGFDGFYTYFASDGFVYGSTTSNWGYLSKFAKDNELQFIPCPGPGYIDTRIRPWNGANTKEREGGAYYERMFKNAVETTSGIIAITSFNEWHEGTQIEPAMAKEILDYNYEDYGQEVSPFFYLDKTRELVDTFFLLVP